MFLRKLIFIFMCLLTFFIVSAIGVSAADFYAVSNADSTVNTVSLNIGETCAIDVWVKNNDTYVNAVALFMNLTGDNYYNLNSVNPVTTIFSDTPLINNYSETQVNYNRLTGADSTLLNEFKLLTLNFQAQLSGSAYISFNTVDDTSMRFSALVGVYWNQYSIELLRMYDSCTAPCRYNSTCGYYRSYCCRGECFGYRSVECNYRFERFLLL